MSGVLYADVDDLQATISRLQGRIEARYRLFDRYERLVSPAR
jgi:hypothetical protein